MIMEYPTPSIWIIKDNQYYNYDQKIENQFELNSALSMEYYVHAEVMNYTTAQAKLVALNNASSGNTWEFASPSSSDNIINILNELQNFQQTRQTLRLVMWIVHGRRGMVTQRANIGLE